MARRFKNKGKNKNKRKREGDEGAPPPKQQRNPGEKGNNWNQIKRDNQKFFDYYKKLNLIPEEEWETFQKILVQDLPTTFRVSVTGEYAGFIYAQLEKFSNELKGLVIEGETLEPPKQLPWYPNKGGWYLSAARGPIRKDPTFKKFHEFLTIFTENGGISRQEAVSMIPPLLLQVEPDHRVLDMCAAPGSKTAQMVDIMHEKAGARLPEGVVIANDIDENRCYLMIHQVNRLSSPCVIATQHPAQKFPFLSIDFLQNPSAEEVPVFDRVLADVPCSGDGTLRKNYDLWPKWSTAMGLGLHKIQIQIAFRGIRLLKVGGRMVYSTCSLNPIEDEAVVCELIRRSKGAIELVDVSEELKELKRCDGVSHWGVSVKDAWYEKYEDIPEKFKQNTAKTIFPPTKEEADSFNLNRCLRILPHAQNSGGFFVAVFRKIAEVPKPEFAEKKEQESAEASAEPSVTEPATTEPTTSTEATSTEPGATSAEANSTTSEEVKSKDLIAAEKQGREDPFLSLTSPRWESTLKNLHEFFGLQESLPDDQFIVRSDGKCPRMYLISKSIRQILDYDAHKSIKLVNMGLRVFGKHSFKDALCPYRLNSEGLPPLLPHLTEKRKVSVTVDDLVTFLTTAHPHFDSFSAAAQKDFTRLGNVGGMWLSADLSEFHLPKPILLSGWRGKVSSHMLATNAEMKILRYVLRDKLPAPKTNEPVVTEDKATESVPLPEPVPLPTENNVEAVTETK